jgi:lipoyl-dependent peroxiredoxin
MVATRKASAVWNGNLEEGSGQVSLDSSGVGTYPVSWPARTEEPKGVTSPEELIAGALSTCYSMSLALALTKAGTPPTEIRTSAEVDFQKGVGLTGIRLHVVGEAPGVDADAFEATAQKTKEACTVARALAAVPITLTAG